MNKKFGIIKIKCKGCGKISKRRVYLRLRKITKYCNDCKNGGHWRNTHREKSRVYGKKYMKTYHYTTRLFSCCKDCRIVEKMKISMMNK